MEGVTFWDIDNELSLCYDNNTCPKLVINLSSMLLL